MVKLFDEFNKLTSYDQEEINISSFFLYSSSDFIRFHTDSIQP